MRLLLASIVLCGVACGRPPEDKSETLGYEIVRDGFPIGPHEEMTPGQLCQHPSAYRYPENIPYCNRSVSSSTKNRIIAEYDKRFGYNVEDMDRGQFKIDHLIPLCMGGDNATTNLWPQHRSLYEKTDSLEERLCTALAQGRVRQVEAVSMIEEAKLHLDEVPTIKEKISEIIE